MKELIKLDEALQKERRLLGAQCVTIFQDQQAPARIPIPATRYAIHNLCESQMNKMYNEIVKLQQQWQLYCRQNHYHKPHLFLKDSYLNVAPPSQRALKLRLVREATSTWQIRKERDTMLYEDDLSFLTGMYYDSLQRQRDYERYYIIANRYGAFSEAEFLLDARPGKRYFSKVTKAALKLQLLWDRYWAMQRLKRFRACRMIQKHWRGYSTYKKLHPIIRLRMKIGKKTYYMFCFARWREYNEMCRTIREALRYFMSNYVERCFFSWKNWARETRELRNRRMGKLLQRSRNPLQYRIFRRWKTRHLFAKALWRRLRLLFSFPTFYKWVEYTRFSKLLRRLNAAARVIQAAAHTMMTRRRFLHKKHMKAYLNLFAYLVIAKSRVREHRFQLREAQYQAWLPDELQRRGHRANELERQRLHKKQVYLQEREKSTIRDLAKFLSSPAGVHQLEFLARHELDTALEAKKHKQTIAGRVFGLTQEERHRIYDRFAHALRGDAVLTTRILESYNFDVKYPAQIVCPHPQCRHSFSSVEQYHSHVFTPDSVHRHPEDLFYCSPVVTAVHTATTNTALNTARSRVDSEHNHDSSLNPLHKDHALNPQKHVVSGSDQPPNDGDHHHKQQPHASTPRFPPMTTTQFHLWLRDASSQDFFREYFLQLYGHAGVVNVFDCWVALQDLRKHPATTPAYYVKALALYELYLRADGTRSLPTATAAGNLELPLPASPTMTVDENGRETVAHGVQYANEEEVRFIFERLRQDVRDYEAYHGPADTDDAPQSIAKSKNPLSFSGFFRRIDANVLSQLDDIFRDIVPSSFASMAQSSKTSRRYAASTKQSNDRADGNGFLSVKEGVSSMNSDLRLASSPPESNDSANVHGDNKATVLARDRSPPPAVTAIITRHTSPHRAPRMSSPLSSPENLVASHGSLGSHMLSCLGLGGQEGLRIGQRIWTTEFILLPNLFDAVEYACFGYLRRAFAQVESRFQRSPVFVRFQEAQELAAQKTDQALREDFARMQRDLLKDWTRGYLAHEAKIIACANSACDAAMEEVLGHYFDRAAKIAVRQRAVEHRFVEQALHEERALLRDEACAWTEEAVLETTFDFYVRALLDAMWSEQSHRKGMLQYAGLLKISMRKSRGVLGTASTLLNRPGSNSSSMRPGSSHGSGKNNSKPGSAGGNTSNAAGIPGLNQLIQEITSQQPPIPAMTPEEAKQWFDRFLRTTVALEKATIPLAKDVAALRIQRLFRGTQGRVFVRPLFAKRFKKYYDESAGAYYYCDIVSGETSWERPRLFRRLYPRSSSW